MTTPCPSCGYTGKPWPGKGTDRLGALIVKLVAHAAYMEVPDVIGSDQGYRHVVVRAAAIKIMRDHAELSWVRIGRIMGGRKHSTMMNSMRWWKRPIVLRIEAEVIDIIKRNIERPIA